LDFPVTIGGLPLHVVFEVAAFFFGFRYYILLKKRSGDTISSANRTWILIAAIFGAFIGSRLVGGLEDPSALANAENPLLYFYMNKTVLGGFAGGLLTVELVKKIIGEKKASGDLFTFPLILGLIIGRIGCFSMGVYEDTYGTPTRFFTGMDLGDGVLRHPVTLYEMVFLILCWIGIRSAGRRLSLANGAQFKLFFIAYFLFRFCCDFIKPGPRVLAGLTTIQLVSLLGILWYINYIIKPSKLLAKTHK
jgi:phosphatidylglycerol---prolipoprotein diacylglyceryl transferase